MRSFTRNIILIINILFVLGLVLNISAINISPTHLWYLALIGFSFPIVLCGHFFFAVFWLFFRHRVYALISVSCLLIGFYEGGFPYEFHKRTNTKGITLVSYNVQIFNAFNWHKKQNRRDSILSYLKKIKPDIICFQEYCNNKIRTKQINDSICRTLHLKYFKYEKLVEASDLYDFGLAIYSKYPIITQKKLLKSKLSSNNVMITDIVIGKDTVRVFNCHLESIHLGQADFETIDKIKERQYTKEDTSGINDILHKLKDGFLKRATQADTVSMAIKDSPYPVIVCGDFNDIAQSYTYHTIKTHNDLIDAFRNSGRGMGGTYAGNLPSFRIDFIFHSTTINSWNFKTGKKEFSDHLPIYCQFALPSK